MKNLSQHRNNIQVSLFAEKPTYRHKKVASDRDISLYQADEAAPNDDTFKNFFITLQTMIAHQPETEKR